MSSKSLEELRLIRNEIFARKGYVFKSSDLQKYFESKEWYVPNNNNQIILSKNEKSNIDLIRKIEAKKKKDFTSSIELQNSKEQEYRDTIAINYKVNKKILDILPLFPETNMGS